MLSLVQVCYGCWLHDLHHCLCHFSSLFLSKCSVEMVQQSCGNAMFLLHQFLGCVYVKGDSQ